MDVLECMLCDPSAKPTYLQLSLLEAITKKFSDDRRIGSGGFAVVYKGQLRNGMVVAVKKLSEMVVIHENKFMQEVDSLMRVKHKNIVRFLGYCSDTQGEVLNIEGKNVMAEKRQRLLCFEFLPKGSLDKYITDASCGLEWHLRYDIIKGICFGLHYLHTQCNIAHMDLKPHNILMDDNMVAKIGDFGTSRLIDSNESMVTLNATGTRGYMAPEYNIDGLVSKKADIFSFGVIILELLTGSRHYDLTEESSMALYTVEVVGKWMKRLPNAAYSQQVSTCVLIAIECVCSDKDKRPTTECIINKLIKVESEIREKLITEGQESWSWVEGITNVTVGVVALVLILRSWLLTVGVAVIVLLCLQNPMSSWPRVVWVILFVIGAVLLTVLILIPTALLQTILVKVAIFVGRSLTILVKVAIFVGRLLWHHEADLLTLLGKVVTAAMVKVLSAIILHHEAAVVCAVLILLDPNASWTWVATLWSWVATSWSWVVVARTTTKTITPINLLAIAFVDKYVEDSFTSRAWIILFFAIEAAQATVINVVNHIISLPLVATAHSVVRFLVALLGINFTTVALLRILDIKSSRKRAILFAEGGLLLILLNGPITFWSWLMVDIMTPLTLFALGFMAVILLPLLWSTSTSESASLLLYPVAVALAADIVIIRGIMGIFAVFAFALCTTYMCEEQ